MILLDTETTELLKPEVADLSSQTHMVEIALIKVDYKYKELDTFETLLNPGVPFDEEAHKKMTGITSDMIAKAPTFLEIFDTLAGFFLGQDILIAHNLAFDLRVLVCELKRIGKEYAFPYPPNGICTVEATKHLTGHRLKLTELYKKTFNREFKQEHRAMSDVRALLEIVRKRKVTL